MTRRIDGPWSAFTAIPIAIAVATAVPGQAARDDDAGAIRHALMATADKPEAPLVVDPIAVGGDNAIAGWTQDGPGGRARLRRMDHASAIHSCGGDALRDADALKAMGRPTDLAPTLAADLGAAESKADPARAPLFSSLDGIVELGTDGSHPAHQHGAAQHAPESHAH